MKEGNWTWERVLIWMGRAEEELKKELPDLEKIDTYLRYGDIFLDIAQECGDVVPSEQEILKVKERQKKLMTFIKAVQDAAKRSS